MLCTMFYLCKGWSPLSWRNFYIKEILQDWIRVKGGNTYGICN